MQLFSFKMIVFQCNLSSHWSSLRIKSQVWRLLNWEETKKFIFCFSLDFGGECLQKRKKSASMSVFVLDSKTKDNKIVLQGEGFEISGEQQGLLLQSRKKVTRWQSFWKTHWNYRGIKCHEFFSKWSKLFRPQSHQVRKEVAIRGPMSYKNWMKDFFGSLL